MQIIRQDDPRDKLAKATRFELADFANAKGLTHITCEMPAPMIAAELRARGLTNIDIPDRPLGLYVSEPGKPITDGNSTATPENAIDADALLAMQYKQQQEEKATEIPISKMTMGQLRAECKRLGIKMSRRDNMQSLREKLDENLESDGKQNAA